jgi:hypothetical protein
MPAGSGGKGVNRDNILSGARLAFGVAVATHHHFDAADVVLSLDADPLAEPVYHFEDFITVRHLDVMARIMLATGLIVAYSYVIENFMTWYNGDIFEAALVLNRVFGPYGWLYWLLLLFNVCVAQLLWFRRVRTSLVPLFVVSLMVNIGMWIERFVIVVGSLSGDFLPRHQTWLSRGQT